MNSKSLEVKRHFIKDKMIIGIDPAKKDHQVIVLDTAGIPICKSFKFSNNYQGFNVDLWEIINRHINNLDPNKVVFAVEISINLWQKLCYYLSQKGFTVLMVSPLFTHFERPKINNNFSRTDPKDALAVANCARQGYFNFYKNYTSALNPQPIIRMQIKTPIPKFMHPVIILSDNRRLPQKFFLLHLRQNTMY